jgi:hypothetical protein
MAVDDVILDTAALRCLYRPVKQQKRGVGRGAVQRAIQVAVLKDRDMAPYERRGIVVGHRP